MGWTEQSLLCLTAQVWHCFCSHMTRIHSWPLFYWYNLPCAPTYSNLCAVFGNIIDLPQCLIRHHNLLNVTSCNLAISVIIRFSLTPLYKPLFAQKLIGLNGYRWINVKPRNCAIDTADSNFSNAFCLISFFHILCVIAHELL